jgi:hypothetical protein
MPIQISRIVLASSRPLKQPFYFKIDASDVFISKVTQTDHIQEDLSLSLNMKASFIFEIWNYEPLQIIKSWRISQHSLGVSDRKYVIADA